MNKNIIILILILAFIGVVVFLNIPKVQGILSLRRQIEQQKELFSEKQGLLAKTDKLSQFYKENQEDLEKANYILPSGQDLPNLIVGLENMAFGSGLILEGVDFSTSEQSGELLEGQVKKKDYKILDISLKVTGDYLSFESFLKKLGENIRLIDITSLTFSKQEGESPQFFNFNLQIKTYYQ